MSTYWTEYITETAYILHRRLIERTLCPPTATPIVTRRHAFACERYRRSAGHGGSGVRRWSGGGATRSIGFARRATARAHAGGEGRRSGWIQSDVRSPWSVLQGSYTSTRSERVSDRSSPGPAAGLLATPTIEKTRRAACAPRH
jgi:hypothetical protein